MKMRFALAIILGFLATNAVYGADIQCDRQQSFCVTEDKRLTYGDAVGIFNHDDEIVALAEVRGLNDKKRRVVITQKWGTINKGYDVRYISDDEVTQIEKHYTIYRKSSDYSVGGTFGLMSINLAEETSAYSADGFIEKNWRYGIQLVGRGMFLTASGTAIDVDNDDRHESFQTQGLSLLPGMAYHVFRKNPISLRGEIGLGLTYLKTSTTASLPRALEKVDNGVSVAARTSVGMLYNGLDTWHPLAEVAFIKLSGARATTISLGISKELK